MSSQGSDIVEQLPKSPEEVLLEALRARDAHDHARITALCDPESVRERFEGYCRVSRPKTIEWFATQMPDVAPDELKVKYERWLEAHGSAEPMNQFRGLGVSSHDELVALGPQEFLTRDMARDDHQWDLIRRLRARGRPVPPELFRAPPGLEYEVLGGVHEPPDLVHLLYRIVFRRGQADEFQGPVVRASLRRQSDGAWRILAEHHFLEPYGPATVSYIGPEFADLYDESEWQPRAPRTPPQA